MSTPFKYRDAFEYDAIMEARSASYAKLLELMKDERVVVFDSEDGKSTDFVNTTLKHFRDKYPERNIYLFVDNFSLNRKKQQLKELKTIILLIHIL